MGISSDIFITREKAEKMLIDRMLFDHKVFIESVIKNMKSWQISGELNNGSDDLYYYNIEGEFGATEEELMKEYLLETDQKDKFEKWKEEEWDVY